VTKPNFNERAAKISSGKEKEKKEATLCRCVLHRLDNVWRILLVAVKKDTTQNLPDKGGGKEKNAGLSVGV